MLHDTMLMSYVLEAHLKHELPLLAARSLARSIPTRESVVGKGAKAIAAKDADPKAVVELLGEEAAAIRALHAVLMTRLDLEDGLMAIYETLEQPLIGVLRPHGGGGVALDDFRLATVRSPHRSHRRPCGRRLQGGGAMSSICRGPSSSRGCSSPSSGFPRARRRVPARRRRTRRC